MYLLALKISDFQNVRKKLVLGKTGNCINWVCWYGKGKKWVEKGEERDSNINMVGGDRKLD
jgi:hypothetical protein